MSPRPSFAIEQRLREETPHVLGIVTRRCGDFSAAEDAVQEALVAASLQWPNEGMPENPRAWLIHVATRKLTDHVRSESARRRRETAAVLEAPSIVPAPDDDRLFEEREEDALLLLFMCCHPSLTRPTAIALTLRAVGGLTTAEIAQAFLVPEATMAQRISRAKQTIKSSEVSFEVPTPTERDARVSAVLHVLYLVFNEGYVSSGGDDLQRVDLAREAIRLARGVCLLLPDHEEAAGLLSLMLLTDARRHARSGPNGELVPLDEQDRARWDRAAIEEGVAILSKTLPRGAPGPYQLQAAIAAVHDEAPRPEVTDWPQIKALYEVLMSLTDSPIVALNHAVAVAMVEGPAAGLRLLKPLDREPRMKDNHRLDAVRGHLFERVGDRVNAIAHYRAAARRTTSTPERNYLLLKAGRLEFG